MSGAAIRTKIMATHPELKEVMEKIEVIQPIRASELTVMNAVCSVVISQMLSRRAADVILQRVRSLMLSHSQHEIYNLSESDLRSCGVSYRKIRTICLLAQEYMHDPMLIERWRFMEAGELFSQVQRRWGISYWTASMLAIFHFGLEDVFPIGDGTISRVLERLKSRGIMIRPDEVKPFRSYMALYLWRMADQGII